nr:Chain C, 10MER PEPTIDE [Gallus gallus]
TAGQSNYDRL